MSTTEESIELNDIVYVGKGEHLWKVWVIDGEYAHVATLSGHANRRVLLSRLTHASEADVDAAMAQFGKRLV